MDSLDQVEFLASCPHLISLNLDGNPCVGGPDTRQRVSRMLPSLQVLDDVPLRQSDQGPDHAPVDLLDSLDAQLDHEVGLPFLSFLPCPDFLCGHAIKASLSSCCRCFVVFFFFGARILLALRHGVSEVPWLNSCGMRRTWYFPVSSMPVWASMRSPLGRVPGCGSLPPLSLSFILPYFGFSCMHD